ncbi:uncharacterized protein LOC132756302 isoform X2 [Ruditapes philippinarum]|uniref:uncharacterized protein LOC132756302 isoform X2 n=1 Tax=Ruditapes philippinarum TaxID=129788 RepID=UPI00295A76B6|nr:uncharacterized protein LOC132756302 isoform X2 [Ruditapes philippinarum]
MQKINKNNVVLEGGGQFEEGQAYVIRDRYGNARTMLWQMENSILLIRTRELWILVKEAGVLEVAAAGVEVEVKGNVMETPQACHMSPNVRGSSPMINNGVRQTKFNTPVPTCRPQLNYMRQTLMQQVGHPSNQQLRQLSSQGHVIHTSPGTPNVPIISVVTSPGLQGQVVQQRPKLPLQNLMPAAQIKSKPTDEASSESDAGGTDQGDQKGNDASSDKEHVLDPPNVPKDPSAYAVCQYCGTTSMDKFKCESCKRMFTSATRYVIPNKSGDGNPETKRRKLNPETLTVSSTITTLDKNSFYSKKFQEQNEIYVKVINAANNTVSGSVGKHQPRIIRQTYGRGKRGRGRGRGMFVPETVTISSDEEESNEMNKSQSQSMSAPATPASVPSRSPSHAGDQPECPESPLIPTVPITLKKGEKAREGAPGAVCEKSPSPIELTLNARTVRVGTFRGAPVEPILISNSGLNFFIEGVTGTHRFHIYPQEIQQCLTKFEGETNLIFFLTTQSCAVRTRKDLGMVVNADPSKPPPEHYYDPLGTDTRHQDDNYSDGPVTRGNKT